MKQKRDKLEEMQIEPRKTISIIAAARRQVSVSLQVFTDHESRVLTSH